MKGNREGRWGTFGQAISLVTREQGKQLTEIEKLINKEVAQMEVEAAAMARYLVAIRAFREVWVVEFYCKHCQSGALLRLLQRRHW